MGPPSNMWSVVDRNVGMRRMTVLSHGNTIPWRQVISEICAAQCAVSRPQFSETWRRVLCGVFTDVSELSSASVLIAAPPPPRRLRFRKKKRVDIYIPTKTYGVTSHPQTHVITISLGFANNRLVLHAWQGTPWTANCACALTASPSHNAFARRPHPRNNCVRWELVMTLHSLPQVCNS